MGILYQFGSMKIAGEERHILRVKSEDPIDLPAGVYLSTVEKSFDMEVTNRFKISGKIAESEDRDGNHYVWYTLSEHTKTIDRSPAALAASRQNYALIDYLSMMSDIPLPEGM